MLVLKDILGGSLKITPENSKNLARQKIASKESLGISQWGKNGRKRDFGLTGKREENGRWENLPKNGSKMGFSTDFPVCRPLFYHIPGGPKSMFHPFFLRPEMGAPAQRDQSQAQGRGRTHATLRSVLEGGSQKGFAEGKGSYNCGNGGQLQVQSQEGIHLTQKRLKRDFVIFCRKTHSKATKKVTFRAPKVTFESLWGSKSPLLVTSESRERKFSPKFFRPKFLEIV